MKIFILTTHLEMGGIPIYVIELARALKRNGHEPIVFSSGGPLQRRLAEEGIRHHRIHCRTSSELNPKLWLRALPLLLKIFREEQPDLIHAHTRVTQALAWGLSALTGVPYVTTCHGLYRFRWGRRVFRCWGSWVMAVSHASMERLIRQYRLASPHQVVLVENGIDVDRFLHPADPKEVEQFRQAHGLDGRLIVGAIARLSPVKGLDLLLKAVPPLLKEFPDLKVLLVGDGPERENLVRLAYELGIADRVAISPSVEDTRVPLSLLQVFVAPAWREGFGLAIVEAMAAGVPVVASDAGGPAEIIENGKSGLLVPAGDVQAVENSLRALLKDQSVRQQIADRARRRAAERYNFKRVATQVEEIYVRALNGHAR